MKKGWTYAKPQASASPLLVIFDFGIVDVYLFYSIEGFFFQWKKTVPNIMCACIFPSIPKLY